MPDQKLPPSLEIQGGFGIDANSGCEALHFAVMSSKDAVHLQYCQPISYVDMSPEDATELGQALLEAAKRVLELQKIAADLAGEIH